MAPPPVPTIHLFSFGYQRSGVPRDDSGHGGGFVFDCRALPNPHRDEALRPLHGWEPPVIAFMEAHPAVGEFAAHAAGLVLSAARVYRERGFDRLLVAFGCTGGRHRSVYQAERLREVLAAEGFPVSLTHLDRDRPAATEAP